MHFASNLEIAVPRLALSGEVCALCTNIFELEVLDASGVARRVLVYQYVDDFFFTEKIIAAYRKMIDTTDRLQKV